MSTINFNDGTWETVGYKITKRGRKPKGGNKVAKELKWPSWCGEDSGCEEPSGKPCRHLEPNGNCDVVPVPKKLDEQEQEEEDAKRKEVEELEKAHNDITDSIEYGLDASGMWKNPGDSVGNDN